MKDKIVGLELVERLDDKGEKFKEWRVFAIGYDSALEDEVYYAVFNEAVATVVSWCLL